MEHLKPPRPDHSRFSIALLVFALLHLTSSAAIDAQPRKWEINHRANIVNIAASQLQVREKTGHNDGPEIRAYLKVTGLGEGLPWCAAFVSWVFEQTGTAAGPRSARVVDWFKNNVVYQRRQDWRNQYIQPQPGMVIGLYYPKLGRLGHIGIVAQQPPGAGRNVYTIEGNTNAAGSREGQGVYKKIRPWATIAAMADHCTTPIQFKNRYCK